MDGHISNKSSARQAAANGRFSTSLQNATASADQIEFCRSLGRLNGYRELAVAMPETAAAKSTCARNSLEAAFAQTLTDLYVGGVRDQADGPAMPFTMGV